VKVAGYEAKQDDGVRVELWMRMIELKDIADVGQGSAYISDMRSVETRLENVQEMKRIFLHRKSKQTPISRACEVIIADYERIPVPYRYRVRLHKHGLPSQVQALRETRDPL